MEVIIMEKRDSTVLWQLFKAMFVLSASTFGGGFVIVSLMKKKFGAVAAPKLSGARFGDTSNGNVNGRNLIPGWIVDRACLR